MANRKFEWAEPLPKENIVSRDTKEGRIYTGEDGTEFWSMTTMLGMTEEDTDWYQKWVDSIGIEAAEAESKRCCDRGEMIHLACELYVANNPIGVCYEAAGQYRRLFMQLKQVLDQKLGIVHGIELPVFSKLMRVGGRLDLCAEWKTGNSFDLAIIDYKGSNFLKSGNDLGTYSHQLCGYSLALQEMYKLKATKLVNIVANERSLNPSVFVFDRKVLLAEFAKRIKKFHSIIDAK